MTEEQKQRVSEATRKWWKENPNYHGANYGKKFSQETKEKMRLAKLGKKRIFSEEHKINIGLGVKKAYEQKTEQRIK